MIPLEKEMLGRRNTQPRDCLFGHPCSVKTAMAEDDAAASAAEPLAPLSVAPTVVVGLKRFDLLGSILYMGGQKDGSEVA